MVMMLFPSYPLDLWKVGHISTVDVEQPNFILTLLTVVSPLNAHDQIDAKKDIRMSFSK